MAATAIPSADGRKYRVPLSAGDAATGVVYVDESCVVAAYPGAGGTILAEASFSSRDDISAGRANWSPWDFGASGTAVSQVLMNATAVRFTCAGVAGVAEVSL